MSYELGIPDSSQYKSKDFGFTDKEKSITKQPKFCDSEGGYFNPLSEPATCPSSGGFYKPTDIYNPTEEKRKKEEEKEVDLLQVCCDCCYCVLMCCQVSLFFVQCFSSK